MTAWRLTELALFSLGLTLKKKRKVKTERVAVRLSAFQLPENGEACFRKLDGGCWYTGFPSTGPARQVLRATGLADAEEVLQLGDGEPGLGRGYWAIEVPVEREGHLHRIRLWWLDHGSARAVRVVGFFRRGARMRLKAC